MHEDITTILDEVRTRIARREDVDGSELEARIRAVPSDDHAPALAQLRRLLAVHRAKRTLDAPAPAAPSQPAPRRRAEVYRAKPTIAANIAVRARAAGDSVVLEWEPQRGVVVWEARVSERPDARDAYTERETLTLDVPSMELTLGDLPQRVNLVGRNAGGRILHRALISGLTRANWSQRWQQRPSAS
jgi:hypothetical protein